MNHRLWRSKKTAENNGFVSAENYRLGEFSFRGVKFSHLKLTGVWFTTALFQVKTFKIIHFKFECQ